MRGICGENIVSEKKPLYHIWVYKDGRLVRTEVFEARMTQDEVLGEEGHDVAPMDFQEQRADGSASYSGNKIGLHDMTEF